jgi:DNA-binding NarL/FixJ family response regulator
VAWRARLARLDLPAIWIAPPNSSSFSVSVVLPASGCEMMAKVRRGQAKGLGAVGYLPKAYSPSLTRSSIVGMLTEYSYAAAMPAGAGANGQRFPRAPSASSYDRVAELGPRHLEILELVLSGCSNQEISNSTKLSLGTVKNYVSTILLALDVKSRSHLISLFR